MKDIIFNIIAIRKETKERESDVSVFCFKGYDDFVEKFVNLKFKAFLKSEKDSNLSEQQYIVLCNGWTAELLHEDSEESKVYNLLMSLVLKKYETKIQDYRMYQQLKDQFKGYE